MNEADKTRAEQIVSDLILVSETPGNMVNLLPEETLKFIARESRILLAIIQRQSSE